MLATFLYWYIDCVRYQRRRDTSGSSRTKHILWTWSQRCNNHKRCNNPVVYNTACYLWLDTKRSAEAFFANVVPTGRTIPYSRQWLFSIAWADTEFPWFLEKWVIKDLSPSKNQFWSWGSSIGLWVIFLGDKQSYEMNNQIACGACSSVGGGRWSWLQKRTASPLRRDSFWVNRTQDGVPQRPDFCVIVTASFHHLWENSGNPEIFGGYQNRW